MTPRPEVAGHLAKSAEFLTVAIQNLADERFNAAVSNAALAGINAKDAICYARLGSSKKSDDHASAEAELRRVGGDAGELAVRLGRLVRLKNKAQYGSGPSSRTDADHAVRWAQRMYDGARLLVV